jgi:hypothetical protein
MIKKYYEIAHLPLVPINPTKGKEPLLREGLSEVKLLVLTGLDLLFLMSQTLFTFYKTSYLNEEVNCTVPSLSVSVPCQSCQV